MSVSVQGSHDQIMYLNSEVAVVFWTVDGSLKFYLQNFNSFFKGNYHLALRKARTEPFFINLCICLYFG